METQFQAAFAIVSQLVYNGIFLKLCKWKVPEKAESSIKTENQIRTHRDWNLLPNRYRFALLGYFTVPLLFT